MSRRGPIIIAVVLALLLVAPYGIGMINERAVRNGIERYSERPSVVASVERYERGWLGSEALFEFQLDPDYVAELESIAGDPSLALLSGLTLPVIAEFGHGPILRDPGFGLGTSSIHARVDPQSQAAQTAELLFGMPYLVDFRGRGTFGLGFDYEGDVPPASFALEDTSFETSAVEFAGSFGRNHWRFHGELAQLAVQSMFLSAILESVSLTSDQNTNVRGELPYGSSELAIGRVAITDPIQGPSSTFLADDLRVSMSLAENDDNDYIDIDLAFATGALTVGTGIGVDSARIGMKLEHLDAEAAREIYAFAEAGTLAADTEQVEAEMTALIGRLLANGAIISLDPLSLATDQGEASGRLSLSLDPAAFPPGGIIDELALTRAMQSAGLTLELEAAKPLVQQIATEYLMSTNSMIDFGLQGQATVPPEQARATAEMQVSLLLLALSVQNMIVDNGDTWTTTLSIENGVPMANGEPVSLGF